MDKRIRVFKKTEGEPKRICTVMTMGDVKSSYSYDELPNERKRLAGNGITDLMVGYGDDSKKLYSDCDEDTLTYTLGYKEYRSLEARDVIIDTLVKKYKYIKEDHGDSWWVMSPSAKKNYLKELKTKEDCKAFFESGQELRVRVNDEILHFNDVKDGKYTTHLTAKDYRGLRIEMRINPEKFNLKPYKKYPHYFHILDSDGNVLHTREHYCIITGKVLPDTLGEPYNSTDLNIELESLRME